MRVTMKEDHSGIGWGDEWDGGICTPAIAECPRISEGASVDEVVRCLSRGAQGYLYHPTADEREALEWMGYRYLLSEYLLGSIDDDGDFFLEPEQIGAALLRDGIDHLPCLDECTTLARIIWAIGPAVDDNG